jgi:hypothetical protein
MLKKDNFKFGILVGFIAPLLSLVIYYYAKFYPYTFGDFLHFVLKKENNQITAISVPCLVLNIAFFTFYINSHKDKTAKGIFAITLVYALTALAFKFF